jgi:GAF domain-containing protein
MVALSVAVYWTGGAASPLYFIYFVPLIIQAFHRDWALVLYYGFGGVTLYTLAVLFSLGDLTSAGLFDLAARIFFMLMTVSIAALAVSLLRKREEVEQVRLSRMKMLTQVSELLNQINTPNDLPQLVEQIVKRLNDELGPQLVSWSRLFLVEGDSQFMKAYADPANDRPELARELAAPSCPVMNSGHLFQLENAEKGDDHCTTESFSFKSHLCVPINGTDNESFGVLFTGSLKPNAFKADETKFLEFIARSLGLSIQRLRRMEDLNLSIEMNSCAVATFIGSRRDAAHTYEATLDGLATIAKVQNASLMLWDANAGALKTILIHGSDLGQEKWRTFMMGEGIPGRVLESGEPVYTTEMPQGTNFKSWLALPLRSIRGEPMGVINAWSAEHEPITSRRIEMAMTFAIRAAISIENALERERLQKPNDDLKKAA